MHYYATCAFGFAKSATSVENAICKLANRFENDLRDIQRNSPPYFWTCRVHAPVDHPYTVSFFQPQDVEISHAQEWSVRFDEEGTLVLRDLIQEKE